MSTTTPDPQDLHQNYTSIHTQQQWLKSDTGAGFRLEQKYFRLCKHSIHEKDPSQLKQSDTTLTNVYKKELQLEQTIKDNDNVQSKHMPEANVNQNIE